jgi:hypothetical protein
MQRHVVALWKYLRPRGKNYVCRERGSYVWRFFSLSLCFCLPCARVPVRVFILPPFFFIFLRDRGLVGWKHVVARMNHGPSGVLDKLRPCKATGESIYKPKLISLRIYISGDALTAIRDGLDKANFEAG